MSPVSLILLRSARSSPPSRLLLVLALLAGLALATGCRRASGGSPAGAPGPGAPTHGLAAGRAPLATAVKAVLADCEVGEDGLVRNCRSDAGRELEREERAAGTREALRTYCRAMEEPSAPLRGLAAARVGRLAFPGALRAAADPALLDCLLLPLRLRVGATDARLVTEARPLLRAAVLLAAALREEKRALPLLDGARVPELRAAGYEVLWANGRLRTLPVLERLLREGKEPGLRLAVVRGFAADGALTPEEQAKVCPLLAPLLEARDRALAAAAALSHAASCSSDGDRLLSASEALAAQGKLGPEQLLAVRAVSGLLGPRGTPAQRKRSAALLARVVDGLSFDARLRAEALDHLAALDVAAARKLARRHRADPALRTRAEALLEK